jgi:hypothetical protein
VTDLLIKEQEWLLIFIIISYQKNIEIKYYYIILYNKLTCSREGLGATFNNISAISWRPVLVVKEAGGPGENHRTWTSNW